MLICSPYQLPKRYWHGWSLIFNKANFQNRIISQNGSYSSSTNPKYLPQFCSQRFRIFTMAFSHLWSLLFCWLEFSFSQNPSLRPMTRLLNWPYYVVFSSLECLCGLKNIMNYWQFHCNRQFFFWELKKTSSTSPRPHHCKFSFGYYSVVIIFFSRFRMITPPPLIKF